MKLENKDIISIKDLNRDEIELIFSVSEKMNMRKRSDLLKDKILATLFFQPSTRTRLSFESAMHRLGGAVIGFADPGTARAGDPMFAETLEDTVSMVEHYADLIVIRHYMQGAAELAARRVNVPVISAGDGYDSEYSEHPTQALLDLYTILKLKGSIDGLKVALVGNLRYMRCIHSLGYGLAKFDVHIFLVSPERYEMPEDILDHIKKGPASFDVFTDPDEVIGDTEVLYVDSLFEKRISETPEKERHHLLQHDLKYRFDAKRLQDAKPGLIVMHPLPRTDELGYQIRRDIDHTPHAAYFQEAANGLKVRMALLALVSGAF